MGCVRHLFLAKDLERVVGERRSKTPISNCRIVLNTVNTYSGAGYCGSTGEGLVDCWRRIALLPCVMSFWATFDHSRSEPDLLRL